MSDHAPKTPHAHETEPEPNHEGPIRTPKQLAIAVLLSFIVPIAVIVMLASYVTSAPRIGAGSDGLAPKATAARIAPVARVEVKDANDVAAMKAGGEVYAAQCSACHAAGVAGAPKFADAAAWAPRIATGYDSLLNSALKGKGAMGPQGGGDFSDTEIGRAVVHLTNAAGAKFAEPAAPAAGASAADAGAPTGEAGVPAAAASSAPSPATASDAPAAAANTATAAAATATAPTAAAAAAATTATPPTATATAAAPPLYAQNCAACHAAGIAGAPKFGDKAAWSARLAQGVDGLTASAIKGKGAMPPRGGSQASDSDIKAVVTYMVDAAK